MTTRGVCVARSRCGPTLPAAALASRRSSGPATSVLRSWLARTRRSKRRSAGPPTTRTGGRPALTQAGEERDGAAVAELTDLIDLTGWPDGTRFIVRREPLHPGAQTSLFPSLEFRFWGQFTDRSDSPVEADVHLRATRMSRTTSARLKASGLERFPFTDLDRLSVISCTA